MPGGPPIWQAFTRRRHGFSKTSARFPRHIAAFQGQFAKLVKDIPTFADENRAFLGRTYNLKAIADYETGPNSHVTPERAAEAIGGRAALHSSHRSASGKPLSAIHPLMRVCRM